MPSDCPGDFNQALMELGAVICVPNGQAKCAECPIAFTCLAHRHDKEDMIPVKHLRKPGHRTTGLCLSFRTENAQLSGKDLRKDFWQAI